MRNFWLLISVLWLWTCSGGGGSSPTEPQEPAPVSNFTAAPTTLIQGQSVTFTSTSTGTITSYAWNVDADPEIEGVTSTYTHTYSDFGTYSVVLTVTGPGGSNSKTVADMIIVSSAAPTPTTVTTQTTQEDESTTISLTATDPNGQAVTFAITSDPTNGTATLSGAEITYTPNANFYGTDSFDYTASNGTYTSDPVTITITVEGEDDGNPTTNDVSATTDEDTVVNVNLDATEIDGDNYSFSIISQPSNGTLGSINGNQVEYTPNQDWNGTDTFTFEATDDRTGSRSNVATATITVNAVNDAPVANDITSQVTDENRAMQLDITLDATDVEGDALTYSIIGTNNGTVTVNESTATYTPNQDWNGEDTFTYKANDGNLDSNTATVTVTVNAVNDAPETQDQSASTNEDTALTITLSVVDVDTQQGMTRSIVSSPSNGSVVLSGSGNQTATYTPTTNWNGTDTFTWKANDGELDSNVSTVTITVAAVNDAPTTEDVSTTIDENRTASRSTGITLQGSDVDGDNLTYTVVSGPSNGNASIAGSILTYAANQDWNGTETITYKANDGTVDSNTSTVTITINSVNDAPVTQNVSFTTDEDTPYTESYNAYVSDVEGDNLTITAVTNPTNGTATCDDATNCTYTPNQDFNGTDSFTYKANDGTVDSNVSTVTITVTSVNDAPVANDMTATMDENKIAGRYQPVTIFLNATDVDGDDLTYSVVGSPTNGTLGSINGNQIIYTPTQDYNGEDTFTYKANDGTVDSNTATVTITINSVNDAPVTSDQTASTNEDTAVDITLTSTDVESDTITFSIVSDVSNGTTTLSGSTVTYTPTANYNGTDTFTFKANDGTVDSNVSTVTITVTSVNDAPVTSDQTASTDEDTAVDITLLSTDVEGGSVTYSIVSDVSNGSTSLSGSTVTYTPTANYNGTDTFTFKANDGTDDSNTSTVTITVAAVNDVTTLTNKSVTIAEDVTSANVQSIQVGSQTDIDGDTLTYSIVSNPSNGSVGSFANASGVKFIKYLPNANFNGTDTFTFKANDGTADSNTATVTITVTAVNDAPVANDVSTTIDENRFARMADLALDATDVEGDALTYILVSNPSNGTASVSGSTLTYNANQDWNGTETFTYKANDGTDDSNTATITITVNAINDTPVVVGSDEKNSKSIDFDGGTGSYLGVTGSPGINENVGVFTTAMTVHAWVKADQLENNKYIIAKGNSQSSGKRAYSLRSPNAIGSNANKWEAALTTEYTTDGGGLNGIEYQLYSTSDASLTEWTHLAMTFDGSDIKFYINGSLETTQSVTGNDINNPQIHPNAADEDFRIGDMAGSGDFNFDGKIDAPAIWNTALSSSQISNLYNSGNGLSPTEVATSNLQGYWNFEDNLNDLTSNDNNLGSSGGLSYVSDVPGQYNTPVTASTNEDILSLEISLVGTDVDGDNLTYSIVTNPSNGTVSISGSTATYIPSSNYNGNDSFVYKANDGTVDSANRTVFIEIAAVNDVPTTSAVSVSTNEDTAKAITLVGADVDTGDTLTYSIVSNPSNGSLGSVSGSSVTYTPTANWNGTDTFTFKANDGTADSNTSTVTITVAAVNDAPVANDMSLSLNRGSSTDFTLDAIDPDGDILSKTIVSQPDNGTLSPGIGLNYTYTPTNSLFFGADSLTYKVNDGNLDSDIKTIGFTINEVLKMYGDENTKTFGIARSTQNSTYLIATDDDNDFSIYEIDDSLALINKSTKTTNSANVSNFFNNASTDGGEIGNNSIIVTSKVSDVVVFDKQMNIIFDSVLKDITGGAGFGFVVYDSKELSNGNFLFAGSHWNPNEYPYVLILDSSGNKISDHYFDNGALQATFFTTFLELSDGSYFATSSNGNVNFPLMKLDSEFNILWLDTTDDEVHDSLEINNTIFYTCAYDMGDGMVRARSPIDGSILWSVGLENTTSRDVFLRLHSSGDLIVASGHNYLARITQNGSKVWEKSYDYITFERTGNLSNLNENKNFVEDEDGNLIILNTTKAHRSYGGALFKVDFNDGTKLLP